MDYIFLVRPTGYGHINGIVVKITMILISCILHILLLGTYDLRNFGKAHANIVMTFKTTLNQEPLLPLVQ